MVNGTGGKDIVMYRIIGFDKDKHAFDLTRCIKPDTEQFLNDDIDHITVTERDRTSRLSIWNHWIE